LARLTERSGTCDLDDSELVLTFDGSFEDFALGDGCDHDARLSDDGCQLVAEGRNCRFDFGSGSYTGVLNIDGRRISGKVTYEFAFSDGDSCVSTVDISATRQ
jgi:hypothetical protein